MLAQLQTVDPVTLKDVILIVLAFASPAAWFLGRRRSVRVEPQPVQVQGVSGFVTRDLCDSMHARTSAEISDLKARVGGLEMGHRQIAEQIDRQLGDFRREMKEDRDGLQRQLMDELSKVHSRINAVLEAVAETRGRISHPHP